jgi:glycosyltransferase involved in cell wall biosynthesis
MNNNKFKISVTGLIITLLCIFSVSMLYFPISHKMKKIKKKAKSKEFSYDSVKYPNKKSNKTNTYDIQKRLSMQFPILENKSFVICIPSFNNSKFCEKNLTSVLTQDYDNYRVIYIDDASVDDTHEKVKAIVAKHKKESQVKIISQNKRQLKVYNVYHALKDCKDNEIVVMLDGDDWFAHENVLNKLNQYYANPDVWVTYGKGIMHPEYRRTMGFPIADHILLNRKIRQHEYCLSMPRTFYAELFKKIREEDLKFKGSFYPITGDLAIIFPIIDMAGPHVFFIGEILYIINRANVINDDKVSLKDQLNYDAHLRNQTCYETIESLLFNNIQ